MIHSFLLIGQSNMAGRGLIAEAHEIDTSHILISSNGCWTAMFRPINRDRPFAGVNLAESFAEAYANKHAVDVGLIACAEGNSKLDDWMPGSILYDNAVSCCRLAARTSEIKGVLWHQGECDIPEERRLTYRVRFEKFMEALRRDAGLGDIPFLLGGLGDFLADCTQGNQEEDRTYYLLNRELEAIAAHNANVGFVSAVGLGANEDNIHFNSDALYTFGLRYFDAF
ncbi:MAG: sialate O-acetylesterase [Clostridia bacterium]|nr:sialate O-acetylesterase [Clostridia bacterium]